MTRTKGYLIWVLLLTLSGSPLFGQGSGKLLITNVKADTGSGVLTIAGQVFGSSEPIVELEGEAFPLTALTVTNYMEEFQILALLPSGLQAGGYSVTVTDALDPGRKDTQKFQLTQSQTGQPGATKLEVHGAEPDLGLGALLISGSNLGDDTTLPAEFEVTLFSPDPSMTTPGIHIPMNVSAFDLSTQELAVDLPAGLFPGTFTLTVSRGNQTDTLDVTLNDNSDLDPENEVQTLSQAGSDVTLSSVGSIGGGTVSINDADADSTNELNTSATLNGTRLEITDAGGTLGVDLSSLTDDADADSTNELNTAATLAGTRLEITDAGGTLGVDLSSLTGDTDPNNEIQTLSRTGSDLTLSGGGGTVSVADADADPFNELQRLSVSGSYLTLSNDGGTVNTVELGLTETEENTLRLRADIDSNETGSVVWIGTEAGGGGVLVSGEAGRPTFMVLGPSYPPPPPPPGFPAWQPPMTVLADGGGKVGIKTSAPSANLDVKGTAIIDGDLTVQGNLIARLGFGRYERVFHGAFNHSSNTEVRVDCDPGDLALGGSHFCTSTGPGECDGLVYLTQGLSTQDEPVLQDGYAVYGHQGSSQYGSSGVRVTVQCLTIEQLPNNP